MNFFQKCCLIWGSRDILGVIKLQRTKQWLSDGTRQLVDERRTLKAKKRESTENTRHYNYLCIEIKRCGNADNETYLNEICRNVEEANIQNKSRVVYQSVRQITEKKESRVRAIKDKNGLAITEPARINDRWREHFEELYNGKDTADADILKELQSSTSNSNVDVTPKLEKEEIEAAIKRMKLGKAPGWCR